MLAADGTEQTNGASSSIESLPGFFCSEGMIFPCRLSATSLSDSPSTIITSATCPSVSAMKLSRISSLKTLATFGSLRISFDDLAAGHIFTPFLWTASGSPDR